MEHDRVSWRKLKLLCDTWPKGLHKDFWVLQNPSRVFASSYGNEYYTIVKVI